jgi:hypothetical protein
MLDEEHPRLQKKDHDVNDYTLGRIGVHNVAIACLPAGLLGNGLEGARGNSAAAPRERGGRQREGQRRVDAATLGGRERARDDGAAVDTTV